MLLKRDAKQLAAMRRLVADTDFSTFCAWLTACLTATQDELVSTEAETALRQLQGEARTLKRLLDALASTRDVMDRQSG